jgi:hypothetical protein
MHSVYSAGSRNLNQRAGQRSWAQQGLIKKETYFILLQSTTGGILGSQESAKKCWTPCRLQQRRDIHIIWWVVMVLSQWLFAVPIEATAQRKPTKSFAFPTGFFADQVTRSICTWQLLLAHFISSVSDGTKTQVLVSSSHPIKYKAKYAITTNNLSLHEVTKWIFILA